MVLVTAAYSAVSRLLRALARPSVWLQSPKSGQAAGLVNSSKPGKDHPMDAKAPVQNTADKMKSVKEAWDKAPAGPKKDAALKHYQAAEKAQTAKLDGECIRELDAAALALA
jgi:hypothetical protein